jgi:D-alanyl-D-alanine carboxypeptidase/D-alanyl-D-alanine-endopeptidase (penicillin-binding protein 4)
MDVATFVRQWLPPLVLAAVALGSWQAAERSDFEAVRIADEPYDLTLDTPAFSARRLPKTLQAPVSDGILADAIAEPLSGAPEQTCLAVVSDDRPIDVTDRPDGGLVPASNQKLLTTFAALEVLGPDFTYRTQVKALAGVEDGVLDGDLYLVGDGDPFLFTEDWLTQYDDGARRSHTSLEALADSVVATGITDITGTLIGDESLFDSERDGPWADRLDPQSGPLSALSVNEGFVDWPAVYPGTPRTRSETDNPPLHAVSVLAQLLQERGVTVAATGVGTTPEGARMVAEVVSPPLIDNVTHINSFSSNLGAELLLKRLGLEFKGEGTTAAGTEAVLSVLSSIGIDDQRLVVADGSGLSEQNRLTCGAVASLLTAAGSDSEFADTLAVSGERGTLRERFTGPTLSGIVRAKTGSLRGVTALSGYVDSVNEDAETSFAFIANDSDLIADIEILPIHQEVLESLHRYPEGPTIEQLSPRAAVAS